MFLTLEDLVPNALTWLVQNNISITFLYPTILQYGNYVVKELEKKKE